MIPVASRKSEFSSIMIRKPTMLMLLIGMAVAVVYGGARHELKQACPQLLQHEAPIYSPPDPDTDFGDTFVPCTNVDALYVNEQEYLHVLELCGVLIVSLLIIDIGTFSKRRREGREGSRRKRKSESVTRRSRRFMTRFSRFIGGS